MKSKSILYLISILIVSQLVLAQVPTGSMTTYVVGGNDIDDVPVEDSGESGMGAITSFGTSPVDEQPDIPDYIENEAGITPDSPLYGLERVIERISLALTFGKAAKAKKGLAYANERLMELHAMMYINNEDAAQEAQDEYRDIMEDVNQEVSGLDSDTEDGLYDEIQIEQAINEQGAILQGINVDLAAKGLTAEQQAQLTAKIMNMEASIIRTKFNVQAKKESTKLKIQARKSLTAEQLDALEAQVVSNVGEGIKIKFSGKQKDLEYKEDKNQGKDNTEKGNSGNPKNDLEYKEDKSKGQAKNK